MSSNFQVVRKISDEQDDMEEIHFQNINNPFLKDVSTSRSSENCTGFQSSPHICENDETKELLDGDVKKTPAYWELGYYQQFFDIDTKQVVQRIIWSMIPRFGNATYLHVHIRPNPDLYGPFWIAATLILSVAMSVNIAQFLKTIGQDNKVLQFDIQTVSVAASSIYIYITVLPLLIWGMMWYRQSPVTYTLLEVMCVYGYSLSIYIPLSLLWAIPLPFFWWLLSTIGAICSGSVLLMTFWPIVKEEMKSVACVTLFLILFFHILLAVGFVFYFLAPFYSHPYIKLNPTNTSSADQVKISSVDSWAIPSLNSFVTLNRQKFY